MFSIYKFVNRKLLGHGVRNTTDGQLTLTDRKLFLAIVRLERAVRQQDFAAVQLAVDAIESHCRSIGKQQVTLFAYMYLRFSDATPKYTHADQQMDGGVVRRTVDYRRKTSPTERLIADWSSVWLDRYSNAFFRALRQSDDTAPR